mmetsp:Transcript_40515/g.99512  ORF Transcript_40515/g.99512 Transcript_40515/m.99512 type:complete len:206 (-) Transcript_40515:1179-1796(-)
MRNLLIDMPMYKTTLFLILESEDFLVLFVFGSGLVGPPHHGGLGDPSGLRLVRPAGLPGSICRRRGTEAHLGHSSLQGGTPVWVVTSFRRAFEAKAGVSALETRGRPAEGGLGAFGRLFVQGNADRESVGRAPRAAGDQNLVLQEGVLAGLLGGPALIGVNLEEAGDQVNKAPAGFYILAGRVGVGVRVGEENVAELDLLKIFLA